MIVGEKIKKIRESKGMTQKQLAAAIGYSSQQSIARLEQTNNLPKEETLKKLSEALGVDPKAFYPDVIDLAKPPETNEERQAVKDLGRAIENSNRIELLNDAIDSISYSLNKLNITGQAEAVKRVEELTQIPKYQRSRSGQEGE